MNFFSILGGGDEAVYSTTELNLQSLKFQECCLYQIFKIVYISNIILMYLCSWIIYII